MTSFDAQITFLPSTDLEASREFYGSVLGLEEVIDQGSCLVFKVTDEAFVGMCQRDDSAPSMHVMFTFVLDDVDGWCEEMGERGVVFDTEPQPNPTYGIYHAFFKDPTGNLLEIQRFDDPGWVRRDNA